MMLLVGPEKSGKSYVAAQGSGTDLIGMTYWIEIGGSEGTADYYGRVRGARYEIVPHNGTYQDILDAIRWAVAQPPVNGKPNMIVVDNMTVLWDMLSDEQALFARRRAARKANENRRRAPSLDDPIVIDSDLWNRAKDRWGEVLWMLRRHSGPTLLLARQEIVTAFENDKPTREKTRKIKAERNLPAAVDAIVELHAFGEAHLTGVRTLHWDVKPGESVPFPDFTVDTLLRRLGFEEAAQARQVTEARPEAYLQEQDQQRTHQTAVEPGNKRQSAAKQPGGHPGLTSKAAVELVYKALTDENNPLECLRAIREEWGVRTLRQIPTQTKMWGEMNADDLITKSLNHVEEQAKKREEARKTPVGGQSAEPTSPPTPPEQDQAREHREAPQATDPGQLDQEPPGENDAPPPPDPQVEEPPVAESVEDTSAAEEPQDLPPQRQTRLTRARQDDPKEVARQALLAEAEIQARVKFVTVGEHLGSISAEGEPGLGQLRDFVQAQRSEVIALLEEADEQALADLYRHAPMPDLGIAGKFAPYLDSVTTRQ
ncbi:hypothetical protein [Streptomyces sp. MBT33]|uniref:hypothetical protein n=1 Tax=Streptomyces sp. MBT33 TaxID=1488363 RepID=UPI00190CA3E5|nr:hypothetical protein [Streptomyces sp. MBT33]MBK3644481.1 hypothetical protein [Streptomyces sp. MBT33]